MANGLILFRDMDIPVEGRCQRFRLQKAHPTPLVHVFAYPYCIQGRGRYLHIGKAEGMFIFACGILDKPVHGCLMLSETRSFSPSKPSARGKSMYGLTRLWDGWNRRVGIGGAPQPANSVEKPAHLFPEKRVSPSSTCSPIRCGWSGLAPFLACRVAVSGEPNGSLWSYLMFVKIRDSCFSIPRSAHVPKVAFSFH